MALTLIGKIVAAIVLLVVAATVTTTVVLLTRDTHDKPQDQPYLVGVGIADMTGPVVEITFMGYAELSQTGQGLHTRQFSRAFVFDNGGTRVVIVSAEIQAVGIALRREVVKRLQALYGPTYSLRNVIISATHTHSTPGGHLVDFLLDISILGFSKEVFNAYAEGITRSIVRAHDNMVPARLYFGQTRVWDANRNRSPYSYTYNPFEEIVRYDQDTDNILSQIRIVKADDGSLHGVMNWFAVHTTSMNMTNHLVSSDNLGYAALALEKTLNPGLPTGKPNVVGAFFLANAGDVSPNTQGPRCEFSGDECDNHFQLCSLLERCFSQGPGENMFESTKLIGTAVYEGAMEVLSSPGEQLTDHLSVVHQFVQMSEEVVSRYNPVTRTFDPDEQVRGCVASLGYSFASGTTDGANVLNITQGTIVGNPLLDAISGTVVATPTEDDNNCHAPKPILLATGRANFPIPWHPSIASVSVINLGGVIMAGVPGEPTTMAGRRIRDVIGEVAGSGPDKVLVTAVTNEYIHYVATYEEYQLQRYEAASTIYGPHTLDILLNKFGELAKVAVQGGEVPEGIAPADFTDRTLSLILPVVFDGSPFGKSFGDVLVEPEANVLRGQLVSATFVAANPRNDLKQEASHAVVEALIYGNWQVVATDADWDTRFTWRRFSTLTGTSEATFAWQVPEDAAFTSYRIRYNGAARNLLGAINQFQGISQIFQIYEP